MIKHLFFLAHTFFSPIPIYLSQIIYDNPQSYILKNNFKEEVKENFGIGHVV